MWPFSMRDVVCHSIGLETGTAATDYIQLHRGNAKLLLESLCAKCGPPNLNGTILATDPQPSVRCASPRQ
jgi:hypothetical protein